MTENKTQSEIIDPFHPAQPRIPGVSEPAEKPTQAGEPHARGEEAGFVTASAGGSALSPLALKIALKIDLKYVWIGLTLAAVLIMGLLLFHLNTKPESKTAVSLAAPVERAPAAAQPVPVAAMVPTGPGPIATTAQLAKPWSAAHFNFRDPVTSAVLPAMVVRLPGGSFWGFSLREPFGSCTLEFVTNLRDLRSKYGFEAAYPMVVDPCNGTVFDLTRYGSAPSGLVRGEIAKGSGWRPPTAIEIRVQGTKVLAQRIEE